VPDDTGGPPGDAAPHDATSGDAPGSEVGPSDAPVGDGKTGDAVADAVADVVADVVADAVTQDSGNPGGDGATDASTAPITFVQVAASTSSGSASTGSATFAGAQAAGDLVVLVIGWAGGNASVTQVTDTAGNGYATTIGPTHISAGITQVIYYAKGIAAAQAGSNTVTVTLNAAETSLDVRAVEYAGLDPVTPYDTSAAFGGRSTTASSLAVTTAASRELVFGAGVTLGSFTGAGATYTLRKLTGGGVGVVEDRVVSTLGSYTADAPLASSSSYVMQVATFR
jgi:hypothetical protein